MLGGKSKKLPCYASTLHGDENGGLTTPDDFMEFAEQCKSLGYPAFKVHGWGLARNNIKREILNSIVFIIFILPPLTNQNNFCSLNQRML